ncbi:MAG: acetylxylan esterase [Kiritimatiellae bacterium]|nr:acetylxylan esterase [Kiritimatiellia bacterium]
MLAPDLLTFADGAPVAAPADWTRRRREIADAVVALEFGGMPPAPSATRWECISTSWDPRVAKPGVRYVSGKVHVEGGSVPFSFGMKVFLPPAEKNKPRVPVVLCGDDCWWWMTTDMVNEALDRGLAVAAFNRCELAPDIFGPRDDSDPSQRARGIYPLFPGRYGAIAAWAWGCHRAVDALLQIPEIDPARIAVTGHSRGGKTALLAAATDERIALCGDNQSGCGGCSASRVVGDGGEKLESISRDWGQWFGPDLASWGPRPDDLPFDQHFLCSLIAPRALRVNIGLGDLWSNPLGAWEVHKACRAAWRLLGAEDSLAIAFREGPHRYGADDWSRFLDFCVWKLAGGLRPLDIDRRPDWAV